MCTKSKAEKPKCSSLCGNLMGCSKKQLPSWLGMPMQSYVIKKKILANPHIGEVLPSPAMTCVVVAGLFDYKKKKKRCYPEVLP